MNPRIVIILCIALISMLARGETFLGPTTATNRLLVSSNSAIIITTMLGDFTNSTQVALGAGGSPLPLSSGVLPPYTKFISYFIAEDGFALPNQRVIAGPSGSYAITVDKSFDLKAWSPAILENTSDANRAFYRLRIQR